MSKWVCFRRYVKDSEYTVYGGISMDKFDGALAVNHWVIRGER